MAYFYSDGAGAVCLATTTYAAPDASYTFAMANSRAALEAAGHSTRYFLLEGNCHVDDARNTIIARFLATDCTDLVFIDADVSWEPEQLVELLSYQDVDIVGGVYPYRRPDKVLEVPARFKAGATPVGGLMEMSGIPTGFMRIRRHVIEEMAKYAPTYLHSGMQIPILFERTLENDVRWGGDLNFCNRWRARGGKVQAVYDMVLGHASKAVYRGSLGEFVRRQAGSTLRHICDKIRAGEETVEDIREAARLAGNPWGLDPATLYVLLRLVREADGPVIETGSGLSSILMAAACEHTVYCLEHDPVYAMKLRQMAAQAGVQLGLCHAPLRNGWYDLSQFEDLPDTFALGLNDGPPRIHQSRIRFFDHFRPARVVCDDADEPAYRARIESLGALVTMIGARAAVVDLDPSLSSVA